jgi:NAD(P)H-hydrate epimerase
MERAAHAAIDVLMQELSVDQDTELVVLCGRGNNGGDGFAMARFLWESGHRVTVCYSGAWCDLHPDTTRMSVECSRQYELWHKANGKTLDRLPALTPRTVVIDALFGIGLDRPVEGKAAEWIEAVHASGVPVLAVDIPSGICANTGKVLGCALHATATATIAAPKVGLLLYPAAAYVGKLIVCDIGVTTKVLSEKIDHRYVTPDDLAILPPRPAHGHKGTFGRVLVIGGASGMVGAPYFAAKTAYRSGAGLVEVLTHPDNRMPLQALLPEAIYTPFAEDGVMSDREIAAVLARADAVVLGCGLGTSDRARTLTEQTIRLCDKPLVIDADALNLIAAHEALQAALKATTVPTVLTPHIGEAARLSGLDAPLIASEPIATAHALAARYGAVCALKDARTVVSDGQHAYIQDRGNSGMATGGSGDCLAGLIGALLCQYRAAALPTATLAALGVLIHAMAGDRAAERLGQHAVMASDLADAVGSVLRDRRH